MTLDTSGLIANSRGQVRGFGGVGGGGGGWVGDTCGHHSVQ